MAQERWMRKVGNSWIVAVPARVRAHLGLKHAGHLYWHLRGPKEVILTPHAQRVGGKPAGLDLAPALDAARRRIAVLEAQLAAQPEATLRKFRMQEWLTRFRLEVSGLPEFSAINDRLRRIEDQLSIRRGPWSYRVKRARPRKVQPVDTPVLEEPVTEEAPA